MNALLLVAILAQPLPAPRVVPGTVVLGAPIVSESILHPDGREELLWSSNPAFTARIKATQQAAQQTQKAAATPCPCGLNCPCSVNGEPCRCCGRPATQRAAVATMPLPRPVAIPAPRPTYSAPSYYAQPVEAPSSYFAPSYTVPSLSRPFYSGYPSTYGTYPGGYCPPGGN